MALVFGLLVQAYYFAASSDNADDATSPCVFWSYLVKMNQQFLSDFKLFTFSFAIPQKFVRTLGFHATFCWSCPCKSIFLWCKSSNLLYTTDGLIPSVGDSPALIFFLSIPRCVAYGHGTTCSNFTFPFAATLNSATTDLACANKSVFPYTVAKKPRDNGSSEACSQNVSHSSMLQLVLLKL